MSARDETRPGLILHGVPHPNDGADSHDGAPPRKYNREVHEKIVAGIEAGYTPEHVAARNGIRIPEFREWIRKGNDGDPWLCDFADDVDAAMALQHLRREKLVNDLMHEETGEKTFKERLALGEFTLKVMAQTDNKNWSKQMTQVIESHTENIITLLEHGLPPRMFEQVLRVLSSGKAGAVKDVSDDSNSK